MARSRLGVGATTAALAALALSSAGAAGAGAPAAPAPAAVQAAVFFVQMAPSAVDLSGDGTEVGPFAARTPSNFQFYEALVPAGKHTLQILPVGSATPGGSPLASVTATLTGGSDYSLVSYVDGSGKTQLSLLPFGNDPVPAGSARLVLRNTADSGPVDVYLNNAKVASALADNPAAPPTVSVVEPVGGAKLTVTPAGNASTVLVTQAISFAPAEVADIEVTGAQGSGSTASTLAAQGLFQFLPTGYWEAAGDGSVYAEGTAPFLGSLGGRHLSAPIVGISASPDGAGYWLVAADGGVFTFGDAAYFGSLGALHLNAPIVGMAPTPDGRGYWLVAADGGIFTFGDASFLGSLGSQHLNAPVVGMAAAPSGSGYWLVASDGGVFTFGSAPFLGSAGGLKLVSPVTGMAATLDGAGYWLVAADGGIFSYGNADFLGSAGGAPLAEPVVGITPSDDDHGYHLVAKDGGVFDYGNALYGGVPGASLTAPVVGVAAP